MGVMPHPPTSFPVFSQEWEELLFQTKFLAVVLSLGHLSIKKVFRSDQPSWSNIKQREGAGGVATIPPGLFLTYFSNHEDDIQS